MRFRRVNENKAHLICMYRHSHAQSRAVAAKKLYFCLNSLTCRRCLPSPKCVCAYLQRHIPWLFLLFLAIFLFPVYLFFPISTTCGYRPTPKPKSVCAHKQTQRNLNFSNETGKWRSTKIQKLVNERKERQNDIEMKIRDTHSRWNTICAYSGRLFIFTFHPQQKYMKR